MIGSRTARALTLAVVALLATSTASPAAEAGRIKTLFLGDNGHHEPARRATELMPALGKAGIDMAYTDDLADLNPSNLSRYDALIIYANHEKIAPDQEKALLDFVDGGKGLVVLHCGSFCFLNSPKYIALVGGQFKSHGGEVFQTVIDKPEHPALKGVESFEAWDETYTHTKLSDDKLVLMHRDENGRAEPWTWVREQGKGRVFYTASGHDERVFGNPAFHKLVIAGIRWATNSPKPAELAPLAYKDAGSNIPNYLQSNRWGTQGKPLRQMQEPLAADESMTHLSVPGGFRVERFAAEPHARKPIAMTFDDKGRLWLAETVDYPNDRKDGDAGSDKIVICEDTNGDGVAEKFTTFADKLSVPTSLVTVPGGLIVSQAPDMLFFADTDGDDKADVRKVLFTGFHTDDTHAGPSNLRLGLDGWVYATVGYAGFVGEVGGQKHRFGQSLFRFKPDGSKIEPLTTTSNNTWGLGLTETNEVVYSTANGEHSSYLGLPNRYFESVRGWLGKGNDKMADHDRFHPITSIRQVDWFGGYTAAAGHAVYTARQFPQEYWNGMAFVCEPTGHLVHQCKLERDGSDLVSHDRFNLLASTDEWTAPVAAEVGPDGAVWVLDWYNYIVQHNPTPLGFETGKGNAYVTPLRDKTHGRILRVIHNGTPLGKVLDLTKATPAELVATLKNDNMLWRTKAQWRLIERGKTDVVPALIALAADKTVDATGQSPAALHALWTLKGLGVVDGADAKAAAAVTASLAHPAAAVRRAAVEVLPRNAATVQQILSAKLLADTDPVVRRSALLTLAECPATDAAGAAVAAMLNQPENAKDRWLPLAATTAAARHDAGFLASALATKDASDALAQAVRVVSDHYARGDQPKNLAGLLAKLDAASPNTSEALLAGLAAGWPESRKAELDAATQDKLVASMDRLGSAGQLQLATLARRWGLGEKFSAAMKGLRERLAGEVSDAARPEEARIEAAKRLAQMDAGRDELGQILGQINAKAAPPLASGMLNAAGLAPSAEVGELVVGRWGQFTPALRRQALELLMKRPEWTKALLDGIEAGDVSATDLAIDQSQRLSAHPDKAIAERASKVLSAGGRLPSADRQAVLTALLPITTKTGDAVKGKDVFARNCAKCHKHGELGEQIGPNLTGFNVHPKEKVLMEVIDPNRSVEGNYRQYTVATSDGQVVSGLLASETKNGVELIDSEAKRHVVLREDIDEMIASPKSLMPEGFEKQITPEEFSDLLEFLTAKGKFVPIPLDKSATIVSTQGMFYSKDGPEQRLIFKDWSPKTFRDVPFLLVDPQGDKVPNVIMLHSPVGEVSKQMPKSVSVPFNARAKTLHFLSGISGWGFPASKEGTVTMTVRIHYADGKTEDHELLNGVHFSDYIRRIDVPGSEFAFELRGQQLRYLTVTPRRDEPIQSIELIKGADASAPIVVSVTAESP